MDIRLIKIILYITRKFCVCLSARIYIYIHLLKGRCSGFENVYVYVLLIKCMLILFYSIDCLYADHAFMLILSVV